MKNLDLDGLEGHDFCFFLYRVLLVLITCISGSVLADFCSEMTSFSADNSASVFEPFLFSISEPCVYTTCFLPMN